MNKIELIDNIKDYLISIIYDYDYEMNLLKEESLNPSGPKSYHTKVTKLQNGLVSQYCKYILEDIEDYNYNVEKDKILEKMNNCEHDFHKLHGMIYKMCKKCGKIEK